MSDMSDLPEPVMRRGLDEFQWRALCNLFPGARPQSVLMVVDYCRARGLDPLKKPCHLVPMRAKNDRGEYEWRDVVLPGIYEYRTTAHRTGAYLGHSPPEYGPLAEYAGITAPEWCRLTIYRWNSAAQTRAEYTVTVYFREVVALTKDGNDRWSRAPVQMLTKCAEAAGLREAFPEEFGGVPTAEELADQSQESEMARPRGKPIVQMPRAKAPATESAATAGAQPSATDETAVVS